MKAGVRVVGLWGTRGGVWGSYVAKYAPNLIYNTFILQFKLSSSNRLHYTIVSFTTFYIPHHTIQHTACEVTEERENRRSESENFLRLRSFLEFVDLHNKVNKYTQRSCIGQSIKVC